MRRLIILSVGIVLLPFCVYSQSNYKPGYVVNLKGDTIRGVIDYREWDVNPETIGFKKSVQDKDAVKYGANDIEYFNVNDLELFKRYTGPVSTDPTKDDQISNGKDSSFRTATVFFKVLEQGKRLSLYQYKDNLKIRYFISDGSGAPKELIFRVYNDLESSSNADAHANRFVTENIFRKQLSAYALEYNELTGDLVTYIAKADYKADDILDIVTKINHFSKEELKKNEGKAGSAFGLSAGAGLSINNINVSSGSSYYLAGGRSQTSFGPMLSLGINIYPNPSTRKFQFRIEISGAQNKYKSLYTSKVSPYLPTEASFDELALSLSPQVIYNLYNTDNFKIFIGAGMVLSSYKFSNHYLGTQNHDGAEADIEANEPYIFNTSDNCFIFKGGVQITKYLVLFGSYLSNAAVTKGGYFELSSTVEQVGINVFFK